MRKFTYDMTYEIENPLIILSTAWHYHLGTITNIPEGLNAVFNMNSVDEVSFDVHKEWDGIRCDLWDEIVSFRYIYIPDHNAYYEIYVSIDDTDNTVKHITAKTAGEVELSNRKLNDFHCNDEVDILSEDYDADMPTILYREILPTDTEDIIKKKKRSSLLHRVLADKCPDWSIGHVDGTIANIQRTYTADNTPVYDFLTNTVANEINCMFTFDSVERKVNAYDLYNKCTQCGYRHPKIDKCPKCGGTTFIEGYGNRTGIFLSTENYATEINISGNTDNVKNCLRLTAGDDLMTATVININPNGSRYIYHFSDAMLHDMPKELVDKIAEYNQLYESLQPAYSDLTEQWYEHKDKVLELEHTMMPEAEIPGETTAKEQLQLLINMFTRMSEPEVVAVVDIEGASVQTASNAVKSFGRSLIDPRYKVDIYEEGKAKLSSYSESTESRTWTGRLVVTSLGATDEDIKKDTEQKYEAISDVGIGVKIIGGDKNYATFLDQKVHKLIDRSDYGLTTIFDIEDDEEFKAELKKYSLERLNSFKNSYSAVCETLTKMEVTEDAELYFGQDLYTDMYLPYYRRMEYIEDEANIRSAEVDEQKQLEKDVDLQRKEIEESLDFVTFLGDDLFKIFSMYRKEGDYSNSNYISTDLNNVQLVDKAAEFFEVAQDESVKASEIELTISETLNNLLNIKEFHDFKDGFEIGDWIVTEVDDVLYKMRLISVNYTYNSPETISFTFSNVDRMKSISDDVQDILSKSQSMATTYNTVAHQAKQGDEANSDVSEMKEDGLDSSKYNILAGANNRVVIDEHGMLFRDYDDIEGKDSPEQLRLNSNALEFTEDNWEHVKAAIGKIRYILNGETNTTYGVRADALIAGLMIAGQIYSENWMDNGNGLYNGSHIDLNDGSFVIGGNGEEGGYGIKFDKTRGIIQLGNNISLTNSAGDPVAIEQVADIDIELNKKQDKLTAGDNITIDENNVISAESSGFELPDNWELDEEKIKVYGYPPPNIYGWGVNNKEYYYEEAIQWDVEGRRFYKDNAYPAFVIGVQHNIYYGTVAISTNAEATHFSWNSQDYGPYNYKGYDWYISGFEYSMRRTSAPENAFYGINYFGYAENTDEARANLVKQVIDYAGIDEMSDSFTTMTQCGSGVLFAGGGKESDLSDATFLVSSDGTVNGTDFKIDGTSVTTPFTGADGTNAGNSGMVPAPSVTDNVKYLKGDGTWDEIVPGTSVIANPSGTPTADLNTVSIDDVIYNIAGGGGGGSGSYTETVLWSDPNGIVSSSDPTISLSDNISNYDMIVFYVGRDNGAGVRCGDVMYLVSDIPLNTWHIQTVNLNDNLHMYWCYTSDTSITLASAYSAYPWTLYSLKGLKFGGGSGEGGASEQQILYVASSMSETEINVDMTSYDEYIIYANDVLISTQVSQGNSFPKATIQKAIADGTPIICYGYSNYSCLYSVATNKLTYQSGRMNRIVMIVGIKYGSGGSSSETTHTYSTEEQVVGKWIDGKDVYERTVSFTLASSSAYTSVTLASISDVDNIWLDNGFGINTYNGVKYTAPLAAYTVSPTEMDFGGFLTYNSGNIGLDYRCGQFLWNGTANIILHYTKTTI